MTIVEMGPFDAARNFDGSDELYRGVGTWLGVPAFLSVNYTHGYEGRLIADALRHHGHQRIGLVGAGGMAHGFVEAISSRFDNPSALVEATDLVDALKAIKSPEEIELIKAAAALQDEVFSDVIAAMRPGLRDMDIAALAQHAGRIRGSEQGIVLGSSAPLGFRSRFLGSHMQGRTLKAGDHLALLIEINGPGGFYTEIARTIVLGRATNELTDGFAAVKAAQDNVLTKIRPGASCAAIAADHNDYMRTYGMPEEHRLFAHGQGYDLVERPLIRHDETMCLAEGMCLAVHPGFENERMFAVICDNYLVTNEGVSTCLHKTEKRIFETA
ncbi:MAG: M24 family metallopeptidase [Pseudomonadota bacterium]